MSDLIGNLFPASKRPRRPSRDRFLFPSEWERVREVLAVQPVKIRVYFYFLVLSGARMSEVRLMEWRHLDLVAGLLYKASYNTKSGRSQILPMSPAMCHLLTELPQDTRYCFHGDLTNNHVNPDGPWSRRVAFYHWEKIREAAGVPDVRVHDLRRTCGAWLTMYGENLAIVKDVLHHQNIQTTMVYARLDVHAVRSALTRHAARVIG
jgi:integrase